eukprot:8717985-Alexandrium_andersonii.AAC.1
MTSTPAQRCAAPESGRAGPGRRVGLGAPTSRANPAPRRPGPQGRGGGPGSGGGSPRARRRVHA